MEIEVTLHVSEIECIVTLKKIGADIIGILQDRVLEAIPLSKITLAGNSRLAEALPEKVNKAVFSDFLLKII